MEQKKKVLIITYYWPPSGGAGVQRWLKFAKYLPEFGIDPIIYTPSNPESTVDDFTLLNDVAEDIEVIKRKIFEPYSIYKIFTWKNQSQKVNQGLISEHKKTSLLENISVWMRGNLFIPDARKYWIKPSVRFLSKYLKENKIDAIITTGPPHSMHLIGMQLKEKLGIPWVADFRDPWTKVDYYHLLKIGKWADKKHRKLEKEVVSSANLVLTVSESWAKDLKELGAGNVKFITNGYDKKDFENLKVRIDDEFSIVHIGTIHKERNPNNLWKAISQLLDINPDFKQKLKIRLVGKVDFSILEEIKNYRLDSYVERISYVPHNEIPSLMKKSRVLLLLISRFDGSSGMIPGKVFEYLASERPILALGNSKGDTAKLISQLNIGDVLEYENIDRIKTSLVDLFEKYKTQADIKPTVGIEKYNRRNLTGDLVEILNEIC
ncbi:MAG: glycosyltransferase family 4 protein [Bacteroidales bacterium]|nr:glycosyltransferase family 4 protein [Bacteroidales bacterium]